MPKFYPLLLLLALCQSVNAQTLSVSFNGQNLCRGKVEKINFSTSGDFNADNYFKIQLSDASGDFTNPVELTKFYTASLQKVAFVIPATLATGTHYRIRAVSTSPVVTALPTDTLSVLSTCSTPVLVPKVSLQELESNVICANTTITLNWTVTGDILGANHFFTVQLSDSSGSFTSPYNIVVAEANSTTASFSVPGGFIEGTRYRLRVIVTSPSIISDTNNAELSISSKPLPSINLIPAKPCLGDTIRLIANNGESEGSTYSWTGPVTASTDTLLITSGSLSHDGTYEVTVTRNGCSASTSKSLMLTNCKPAWSWALTDNFWTNTFNYPSTIVDTEIDSENNLFIAGFFSQAMNLGNTLITTINGNNVFCNDSETADKRTGFIAKISANGQLAWYRKWNTQSDISDYQYCDLALDNGQVFLVSEFRAAANCPTNPRNEASLIIADEEDFALGTIIGYCRYSVPNTFPAQYEYRYKGRFAWVAKFDINGNLDVLSNLSEVKTCGISTANFDFRPNYGLGEKGYYSLKARNNKLWLLYTWNQGLPGTMRFINGNETTNEEAGLLVMELSQTSLNILNYQKANVYSPSGSLGMSNLEIDTQNNIIVTGSTATIGVGTAEAVSFGAYPLVFGDTDYFVAKFNTTANNWVWAKQSQLILLDNNADAAPSVKTDSQNNIYLGFSLRTSYGGNFANITLPNTPQDYDSNNTSALLKLNANGDGQWVKLNNHTLRNGRNIMGIDDEDNIYFTSYLNNSATANRFLINEHRLPQKDLATFSSVSGNPFVAIYKPTGDLLGSVNNIRVYDGLYVNGLAVDHNKSIILGGVNLGKASFGELGISTNFGDASNAADNRHRGFITKIENPKSIVLDNTNTFLCTGIENQIRFSTTGSFANTSFKAELIDVNTNKVITVATGNTSPLSFMITDSLVGKHYYARVVTADNAVVGTVRMDKILEINTTLLPVISSTLLGTAPVQGICYTQLPSYRIQTNITDAHITLKRNGETVYEGANQDFAPMEGQTGVYKVFVEHQGCTGESADLDFRVSRPASATLLGTQTVSDFDSPIYLSLLLEGGGEYEVNIAGISSTLKLNNPHETITVTPSQNTTYSLTSVSNYCGPGSVTGVANILLCQNSLSLTNPKDNYTTGIIIKETDGTHGEIVANNKISDSAKVTYSAGRSVILNPGFYVSNSGNFIAEIKGCNNVVANHQDRDFKLGYQKLHINRPTADKTIAEMTEFAQRGARLFEVTLRLDDVFKTRSQFDETNPEILNEYWSLYDKIIKHANNIYDFVVFRVSVDYDDTRYYFQDRNEFDPSQLPYDNFENALFNLFGEIVQDQFNNPARVGYGSGHGSFSSLTAIAKMKGFVQKIMDRYYPILGQKLYWVSVVSSAQFETGFNFENGWDGENFISPHPCEYDYSTDNVNAFRYWLVNERYNGLAEVNSAYNTNYSDMNLIEPPKVGVNNIQYMNAGNIAAMYNTVVFEDWYRFNYKQMKNFLLMCKSIVKAKSNDIKFCFESGSVADQLGAARKTLDVPDINTYADVLKTNTATMSFGGLHMWDGDIVRSNFSGEIETEINEMDVVHMGGITDPAMVKQKMLEYSKAAYLNNTRAIIFVADKDTPYYSNSLDALGELKTWIDTHTEQFSQGETIYINLSDLIRNFPQAIAPFSILSSSLPTNGYENRPKIIINNNAPTPSGN
ncbi:3-coathanger stack domain-containing protein [Emticicia sp. BO119]|uniref:3-coathanger stack domain-containing protein n=1 Tax=Emticicia sp. BO119 TaxID=2757768 RepID=UPI0015F075FE|nr:3-coathanger stack domain-containing protein [Emticicia sp. BO119]MBA4853147.1 beta-galactosidase [Emticicia sp. BO119]